MKKLILMLLAATFSLQLFSAPALAQKLDEDTKNQIKALKDLKKHTQDKDLKKEIDALIKQIRASGHA